MKKSSIIFLSILFILFSGCSKKSSDVKPITSELNFFAEFESGNFKNKYFVEIKKDKTIISVIMPENIKTTKFILTKNQCKASFGGIESDLNLEKNENFMPWFIHNAFLKADTAKTKTENNQTYIYHDSKNISFKLYIGDSGLPLKLENLKNNTEIIIKNAAIK